MPFKVEAKNNFLICKEVKEEQDEKPFTVEESNPGQTYLEVVSAGDQVESAKEGDRIIPLGNQFQGFVFEGEKFIVVEDHQVLGVYK